jgi:AraC-like DNA-binding protein
MDRNICKFPAPRFSGEICISAFVHERDPEVMRQERVISEYCCILFVTGTACAEVGAMRYPLRRGNLLFCFRGETIAVTETAEAPSFLYINFSGLRAEELFHRFGIHKGNRIFNGFEGQVPLWQESLAHASDMTVDLAAESMLLYTLSRFRRERAEESDLVGRIIDLAEKNFTDPALSLSTVAQALSYNEKYVSHTFKARMGVNFSSYLRSLRIKYAVSLLDRGLDSIKNVAYLSGFSDPLYFSGVFKRAVGVSPKEYVRLRCEK